MINGTTYSDSELELLVFDIGTYLVNIIIEIDGKNYNEIILEIHGISVGGLRYIYFKVNK